MPYQSKDAALADAAAALAANLVKDGHAGLAGKLPSLVKMC
jgi:hypothetical protein